MCDQGSLVGLCIQDYKSLCAAAKICATLNTHPITFTQTDNILTSSYEELSERDESVNRSCLVCRQAKVTAAPAV